MTPRERTLSILIGGFIVLMLLGAGIYFGIYEPLVSRQRATAELEDEIYEKQSRLDAILKERRRLETTIKRCLPADPEVARSEYDAVINRLLRDAKVPVTAYSVKPKAVDNRSVPEIAPKRPAYTKVALEITLKPIDHATLIDVLQRYYRLNLLQQITRLTVKKMDGGVAARRGGGGSASSLLADRADLDVTFVTEAIILDGAENRRTLLPLPAGVGAVAGGTPHGIPEPARGMPPLQLAQVLATPDRDYSLMLVKDVFHGPPLPPPPPPKEPEPEPVVQKEDTSPFIRLTGVGRNPDGTGTAFIEDIASKQEYAIELTRKGGKLQVEVIKYYYTIKGTKKSYEPDNLLDISEASSGTARKFRVIGLDGDALIVAESAGPSSAPKEAPKEGGKAPPFGRKGPPPKSASTPPAAALVGGVLLGAPSDRFFAWKHGEPLSKIQELPADEAQKAIQRATGEPPAGVPTAPSSVPVTAPPPQDVNAIHSGNAFWAVVSPAAR